MYLSVLLLLACGDAKHEAATGHRVGDTGAAPDAADPLEDSADPPAPDDPEDPDDSGGPDPVDTGDTDCGVSPCDGCPASTASVTLGIDPEDLTVDPWRTQENPLKGFMTSYLWSEPYTDFPDQMEFLYLPMAELWDVSGETLEMGLEPYLVAAATRGHHAVVRVYIDYPSKDPGLPSYLAESMGCTTYEDYGGGCSPDYDEPDLVEAMVGLIEAMGARYDGDPRLGAVQVGLLGFWGEWHTYPHTDWFPSEATQEAVLSAYDAAFSTTQIQVRRAAVNSVDLRMGFHDDSFAYSTIGEVDWFFVPGLEAAGAEDRWQQVMIGGEVRPELQSTVFAADYGLGTYAQDMRECIDATHASYLLNYHAFNGDGTGYLDDDRTRAEEAALSMGYQFEVHSADITVSGLADGIVQATMSIEVMQTGVAPFYYPVFLSAASDALPAPAVSTEDLSTLLPEERRVISLDLADVSVDVLNGPIGLELISDIVQDGQQIILGTGTPWSEDHGATRLQWDISCATEDGTVMLGDSAGTTADGCDCTCDVDGIIRACGTVVCGGD